MSKSKIKELIAQMTLEEKASLLSGYDFWTTKEIKRLNIPAISMADGPHGLRKVKEETRGKESYPSTCFPSASLLACSWDEELAEKQGAAIGEEARSLGLGCVLGPGANIKRSPLCGRNFEYFSEDPHLSGKMAAGVIKGIQSRGVSACLKHFAANNQEDYRFWVDARVDERALREIYLASFEEAVKSAKPKAMMCSYNKLNGVYASENRRLLTDILRGEWGFEGIVMSDWGAVNNRPQGVWAGLDLEMPGSFGVNEAEIIKAAKGEDVYFASTAPEFDNKLTESDIDLCVERMLEFVFDLENTVTPVECDCKSHHALAREIASECMVLLENNGVLPLKKGANIAVVGEMAVHPRYQGSGSSRVTPFELDKPLDEISEYADVTFAQGYSLKDGNDYSYINEAIEISKDKDAVVIIAGLPDEYESEGYDRKHIGLPENQFFLIESIQEVNKNVVLVVCAGAPVEIEFRKFAAALMAYLGGEAAGGAIADILFGVKNPCGKLAETFPKRSNDNPSYVNFPGDGVETNYGEGIFVGYRWYETAAVATRYQFGHGLSYTDFEYSDIKLSSDEITEGDELTVSLTVTNTGEYDGKEIVQLFVEEDDSKVRRPLKELKGFKKVFLKKGESKSVSFTLDSRAFAHWSIQLNDWAVGEGEYTISAVYTVVGDEEEMIEVRLSTKVYVKSTNERLPAVTMYSDVNSLFANPKAHELLVEIAEHFGVELTGKTTDADCSDFRWYILRNLITMGGMKISFSQLQEKIDKINGLGNS